MSKLRRSMSMQVGGFIVAVVLFIGTSRFFPIAQWVAQVQQTVMHLGGWSAVFYPLLYVCCNVLLLPGGVLAIGSGFFFGLWWGFLIVLAGNVTGAAISFLIARGVGRRWLGRKLLQNRTMKEVGPAIEREGWKFVLLSQLHPLFPTSLLNYLYGLTTIRFSTCLVWVAVGQAPGLFLYCYLGTMGQLGLNILRGQSHPRSIEYWIWGGGLLLCIGLFISLGSMSLRLLRRSKIHNGQVAGCEDVNLHGLARV